MDSIFEKAVGFVGLKVTDKITGFTGVVSSVTFDLYGCVQAIVTPPVDKDGKQRDAVWFDIKRLVTGERVMNTPDYSSIKFGEERGPGERPSFIPS
jgi:hypothetical protein